MAEDGPGILAEEWAFVLRRFARLERSQTTAGHSLGLLRSAWVVELHDAELVLEDRAPSLRVHLSFPPV